MQQIDRTVPAPWTPLQAKKDGEEVVIDVVGRTYRLGTHAGLPTGITTAGEEILAGPVRLVGRLNSEPIEWKQPFLALLQQDDERAVLCGTAETGGVIISTSVKAEYDGLLRFDIAIAPYLGFHKGAELASGLEQLWVEFPLKPEFVKLFTYWPLIDGTEVKTYEPVNSSALPAEGLAFPFKPFIWLGWEEGGLSWFAESDQGWQPADPQRAIEVVPVDGQMVLRLHLLDSLPQAWAEQLDGWYHPNPPVTITFGLQATPVKPVDEDVTARRIVHLSYYEPLETISVEEHPRADGKPGSLLDRVAESGANVMVIHEVWNAIQNYWVTDRPQEITATVAAAHARGMKATPYFGYEVSTLAPEWAEMSDRILVKHPDGRYEGGWQRQPPQRDYMVCYGSAWAEKWLNGVAWMMDEYGFDGVYLDGTTMPWGCCNAAHGCGYRKPDGTLAPMYPIFAVREMMRRLYEIVSARDGIITAHQSSCCLTPTLQFAHSYWDGEHIGGAFKHDAQGRFPLETFQAEFMGRNFGIPAEFLSGSPDALAYTLLHNVLVRPGAGEMLDTVSSIWQAFQRFGTASAIWHPYWRNAHLVQCETPGVYASAYARDGRLLLVVSNLGLESVEAVINVNGNYTGARNAISGEAYRCEENALRIACASMAWALVELT